LKVTWYLPLVGVPVVGVNSTTHLPLSAPPSAGSLVRRSAAPRLPAEAAHGECHPQHRPSGDHAQ
jgi:hypothetical protein